MNPIPQLTEIELGMLRESIRRDGVQYPVLLDGSGNIIDGHHRKQICDELGIECPTDTRDVDPETAERLAVTLNLARRQLTTADQYELIAWLAERHQSDAETEARARQQTGRASVGDLTPLEGVRSGRHARTAMAEIARRINADLADMGQTMRVGSNTVDRARIYANAAAEDKADVRAGRRSVTSIAQPTKGRRHPPAKRTSKQAPPRKVTPQEILDSQARVRAIDAETKYTAMLNAPAGKTNVPLMERAFKIQELLDDIFELTPEKAISHVPAEACHFFTPSRAEWWMEFAQRCEQRRQAETPDVPPARPVRWLPLAERDLTRGDRAMLEWLRTRPQPVTPMEAAVAIRIREDHARRQLGKLVAAELAVIAGRVDGRDVFTAAP